MYMEKTIQSCKTCVGSFCHYLDNKICLNLNGSYQHAIISHVTVQIQVYVIRVRTTF